MSERSIRSTTHRLAIIDAALRMEKIGLNKGTAGNISVRWNDGFLVTPSGMPPQRLRPEDIVFVDMEGDPQGTRRPSSEWRFHRDIYAGRPEVEAVVHGHPPFCVALAVLHKSIPPYHYMVAKAGGRDIRCAPYASFGTQALSDHAMAALDDRKACLLANHGMIATGRTLDGAIALAIEVEELAEGYWRALQLGEPFLLSDEEMSSMVTRFAAYGENAQTGDQPAPAGHDKSGDRA
ncbi:class II aldolase/adducin family protein [Telmatospirillum sp.]|uniref:class II aldolase/adducin family protein n=1 Tax=Telmatospirillum sp. TaxID=2079197 RepID=UPI0028454014|nr:class II aldolase/adducin family protein [Telmatospirillum sp.]MDR3438490.1 class II aldolase/adducin family protein [Telmatospirillum sp.]